MKKHVLTFLFSLMIICFMSGLEVQAAEEFGTSYRVDENTKTLYIEKGYDGIMKDFGIGEARPWDEKKDIVESIVIGEGVLTIGENAFADMTNVKTVTIKGNTMTTVGRRAFKGCANLAFISVPTTVTNIGAYAFFECSSLSTVDLSKTKVTELKIYTFGNCKKLSTVSLPKSLELIDDYCFTGCSLLSSFSAPATLKKIGDCAFVGCDALTVTDFSDTALTDVGMYAFYKCAELNTVTFSEKITNIGDYAFSECHKMKNVIILSLNIALGKDVFQGCSTEGVHIYTVPGNQGVKEYVTTHTLVTYSTLQQMTDETTLVKVTDTNIAYTGKALTPTVVVTYTGGKILEVGKDYTLTYKNNINAGAAQVVIEGCGEYYGTITQGFVINKAKQTLTVKVNMANVKSTYKLKKNAKLTLVASATGNEKVTFTSSSPKYVTVNSKGMITAKATGMAIITVSANNKNSNYAATTKKIKVYVKSANQKISVSQKSRTVTYGTGTFKLGAKALGGAKLTYKSSNTKVLKPDSKGNVKIVGRGTAKITITAAECSKYFSASKTISFKVKPRAVKIGTPKVNSKKTSISFSCKNLTPNTTLVVDVCNSSGSKVYKRYKKSIKYHTGVTMKVSIASYKSCRVKVYSVYNFGKKDAIVSPKGYFTISK